MAYNLIHLVSIYYHSRSLTISEPLESNELIEVCGRACESSGVWLISLHSLAGEKLKDAARAWIDRLTMKKGAYEPDSYPNPGRCSS
jgi:hypothetical protein